MLIDQAKIFIASGKGGAGGVAFRREKYVPKGGPAGGDGGRGGDVIIEADPQLGTLLDLRYKHRYLAEKGERGGTSLKTGRSGGDAVVRLPVGTIVRDAVTGKLVADLTTAGQRIKIAEGGLGGKGNAHFKTSTNRAPRMSQPGQDGIEMELELEMKLIADVGLVGLPNAGKSTLISRISAAKPKIADYPFTTLEPNLGIVRYRDYQSFTVADIPGIIEGAHEGKGLGHRFLRHIERTAVLLVLIPVSSPDPVAEFNTLMGELEQYSPDLAARTRLVGRSKTDIDDEHLESDDVFTELGETVIRFSSVTGDGLPELLDALWPHVKEARMNPAPPPASLYERREPLADESADEDDSDDDDFDESDVSNVVYVTDSGQEMPYRPNARAPIAPEDEDDKPTAADEPTLPKQVAAADESPADETEPADEEADDAPPADEEADDAPSADEEGEEFEAGSGEVSDEDLIEDNDGESPAEVVWVTDAGREAPYVPGVPPALYDDAGDDEEKPA